MSVPAGTAAAVDRADRPATVPEMTNPPARVTTACRESAVSSRPGGQTQTQTPRRLDLSAGGWRRPPDGTS